VCREKHVFEGTLSAEDILKKLNEKLALAATRENCTPIDKQKVSQ
jgi:hypothetical protein